MRGLNILLHTALQRLQQRRLMSRALHCSSQVAICYTYLQRLSNARSITSPALQLWVGAFKWPCRVLNGQHLNASLST